MNLTDILSKATIEVNLNLKNKKDLLAEIAKIACLNRNLSELSPAEVEKALSAREKLASTGLGSGVAVPHCRLNIPAFVVGIITTKKGIEFNSIDNEKVSIFPFVIGPEENPKAHLKVLSGMARLLRNPDTRSAVKSAGSSDELYSLLKKLADEGNAQTPDAPSTRAGMKMLHVFIRDEGLFNDVLQVFASGEPTGAMVIEAHESTEYMSHMPVFAGLWNNDLNTFNRIIVAVVKESLLNQTLRNIEYVCGELISQTNVMVTVTDLHHALGSLDF